MDFLDFFLKEVLLVEKENNGSSGKELVVTYAVEQVQRLMHTILLRGNTIRSDWAYGSMCLPRVLAATSAPNVEGKVENSFSLFSVVEQ